MPKTTPNLDWKSIEKIAALLEKSLSPSAIVEHDVRLPVIGKPKRRARQCDIVIKQGEPPRQTVTIVEVQKRKRKPDINTFHGWVKKMREVGAQHLICVSALGYPKSIIDAVASEYGPTIHLLTLKELEQPSFSVLNFIAPHILHTKPHITIEAIRSIGLEAIPLKEAIPIEALDSINSRVFELQDYAGRLALSDLVTLALSHLSNELFQKQQIEPNYYELELLRRA